MTQPQADGDIITFGHYIVTLIDVLGQGEKLQTLTSIPTNPGESEEFVKKLKGTFGTIEVLRKLFRDCFERYRDPRNMPGAKIDDLQAQDTPWALCPDNLRLGEVYFSDLFLFHAPIYKIGEHLSVREVYAMLTASASIMQAAIAGRTALRGGIDIGIAAELNPNDIYGAALFRAGYLEKHVAQYPRIVVGQELLLFIEIEASKGVAGLDGMPNAITAKLCRNIIQRDLDGVPFVDFLGPQMREIAGEINSEDRERIQKGLSFVIGEHERFCKNAMLSERDRKLAQRYALLRGYYESRKELWA